MSLSGSVLADTNAPDPVQDPRRVVAFEAVDNFRDLGGYRIGDGRTIGWGRLFRADGLQRLTDDDLAVVDGLGIRTVIDLRTSGEIDTRGRFPVERYPVTFHHLSIIDATWTETGVPDFDDGEQGGIDFLVWAFTDMLEQGGDRFAQAIRLLAQPGASPAVFHCAAGKDRTGLLAALILAGLGVDRDAVVGDFGLTIAAMARLRAWLAVNHPDRLADMNGHSPHMFGAHPDAMRRVLADVDAEHGSVANYLASLGVGPATLGSLADQLTG